MGIYTIIEQLLCAKDCIKWNVCIIPSSQQPWGSQVWQHNQVHTITNPIYTRIRTHAIQPHFFEKVATILLISESSNSTGHNPWTMGDHHRLSWVRLNICSVFNFFSDQENYFKTKESNYFYLPLPWLRSRKVYTKANNH